MLTYFSFKLSQFVYFSLILREQEETKTKYSAPWTIYIHRSLKKQGPNQPISSEQWKSVSCISWRCLKRKKNNLRKCINLYITNKNNFFLCIFARILLCVYVFEKEGKKEGHTHSQKLMIRAIESNNSTTILQKANKSLISSNHKYFTVYISVHWGQILQHFNLMSYIYLNSWLNKNF